MISEFIKKDSYKSLVKRLLLSEINKLVHDNDQSDFSFDKDYINTVLDDILLTIVSDDVRGREYFILTTKGDSIYSTISNGDKVTI